MTVRSDEAELLVSGMYSDETAVYCDGCPIPQYHRVLIILEKLSRFPGGAPGPARSLLDAKIATVIPVNFPAVFVV